MSVSPLTLLDSARTLLCFLFLFLASIYDVKSREVPDKLWVIFGPAGSALTLLSIIIGGWEIWILIMWAIIMAVTSGLSIALFYLGLFGGADSKALICLAATMPLEPSLPIAGVFPRYAARLQTPPPISTFNNAVLLAALSIVPILARNFIDYLKSGEIFRGLEGESMLKKILALLTGYRVDSEKIRSGKHFYFIIEEFIRRDDGSILRRLKISGRLPGDESMLKESVPPDFHGKVWVTPGLPFMVFMTLGFFIAVFVGDIIIIIAETVLIH